MVIIQVGTGTQHAGIYQILILYNDSYSSFLVFTFAGCLTGALLYSVFHGYLPSRRNDGKKLFVHTIL